MPKSKGILTLFDAVGRINQHVLRWMSFEVKLELNFK
jgi:hypothetical protein